MKNDILICIQCKNKIGLSYFYKSYLKKGYHICKRCIKFKNKIYNQKNKSKISKIKKNYYCKNKKIILMKQAERFENNLKSWEGLIPNKTYCQICKTKIFYNNHNRKLAICFDHRSKTIINQKYGPTFWLGQHKRTPRNEKIWKKSNFGFLCNKCNSFLPTKNRIEYLKKVIKYVFDKKGKVKENGK